MFRKMESKTQKQGNWIETHMETWIVSEANSKGKGLRPPHTPQEDSGKEPGKAEEKFSWISHCILSE